MFAGFHVWGTGGRAYLLLLLKKKISGKNRNVCFPSSRFQSVAGDSSEFLVCSYFKVLGKFQDFLLEIFAPNISVFLISPSVETVGSKYETVFLVLFCLVFD